MEGLRARVDALVSESADWLIDIRHELHAHPELSNREERTAALVAATSASWASTRCGPRSPAMGWSACCGAAGPGTGAIALRADMDALPVRETSGVPFASTVVDATYPGGPFPVAHACGHDCHVATVLASARVLAGVRDALPGTVMFLFQPAEEGPPLGETGGAPGDARRGGPRRPGALDGLRDARVRAATLDRRVSRGDPVRGVVRHPHRGGRRAGACLDALAGRRPHARRGSHHHRAGAGVPPGARLQPDLGVHRPRRGCGPVQHHRRAGDPVRDHPDALADSDMATVQQRVRPLRSTPPWPMAAPPPPRTRSRSRPSPPAAPGWRRRCRRSSGCWAASAWWRCHRSWAMTTSRCSSTPAGASTSASGCRTPRSRRMARTWRPWRRSRPRPQPPPRLLCRRCVAGGQPAGPRPRGARPPGRRAGHPARADRASADGPRRARRDTRSLPAASVCKPSPVPPLARWRRSSI